MVAVSVQIARQIKPRKMDENEALQVARTPGPLTCPVSGEELYSPMDKLSIALYNKSTEFLEDDSEEEKNLLKLIELL